MSSLSDNKYITLRTEALTNILKLLISGGLDARVDRKLDNIFYSCLKDEFLKSRSGHMHDQAFLHDVAVQASELNWGDWAWGCSPDHVSLSVMDGPYVSSSTGVEPAIPFAGPIVGVLRAVSHALWHREASLVNYTYEHGMLVCRSNK